MTKIQDNEATSQEDLYLLHELRTSPALEELAPGVFAFKNKREYDPNSVYSGETNFTVEHGNIWAHSFMYSGNTKHKVEPGNKHYSFFKDIITHSQKIPYDILLEIRDNPAFEKCFHDLIHFDGFLENFNRLQFTNIRLQNKSKIPFLALIDDSVNPSGLIITNDEMRKLILFTYQFVYKPMESIYHENKAIN